MMVFEKNYLFIFNPFAQHFKHLGLCVAFGQ
jgi:hypothetical protein